MEGDSLIPVYFSFLLLIGWAIAGIVVGVLCFIVLTVILIWCIIRWCKKSKTSAEIKVSLETQPAQKSDS